MKKTLLSLIVILFYASNIWAQKGINDAVKAFSGQTGATVTIDKATNSVSFIKFSNNSTLTFQTENPQNTALAFVAQNKALLGLSDGQSNYIADKSRKDHLGREHITLQQTYKGVPVFDGKLHFHYDDRSRLRAINGNNILINRLNVVPSIPKNTAEEIAVRLVNSQKAGLFSMDLKVEKSTLLIFQKGLAQGYNGTKHLVYEVEVTNYADVREFLYIDAHDQTLVEQFTGMHSIDRKLYITNQNSGNLRWQEANGIPSPEYNALNIWEKSEVDAAGHMYNLIKNAFGYASYDGADATMITIHNNPSINCPNANWNGVTANYCDETAADDVVAHEWGHAYTEYTSGLIYAWQAGAINEAFSDIWGETVDQLNGYFDTSESAALRTGCGSSARWQMGEKASAFGGAIRDMWDPNCKGHPGKMTDPFYHCFTSDGGGVHYNSGVLNHAYALLVDGGVYNGQTINGIGLTKAAHIFWRAQSVYMTRTTDYAALADILESAASDLIGSSFSALNTTTAPNGPQDLNFAQEDFLQLQKVVLAVELRTDAGCGFNPILKPVAALCEGSKPEFALFSENFENGLGGFTTSSFSTSTGWMPRNWSQLSAPGGRTGMVAYGPNQQGTAYEASNQQGVISLTSPAINIPSTVTGNLSLVFDHFIATESDWDGGNIKYRINGGLWTLLPPTAFIANPYNLSLLGTSAGNNNPLAGQPAFSGTDAGTVTGSWGQSQVDLSAIGLTPGDQLQLRWDMGTDYTYGVDGWYIDDVRVYSCNVTPAVHFATNMTLISEGEAQTPDGCLKYVDKTILIQIDQAPTQPVIVTLNTPLGTASAGTTKDYSLSTPSVTLQAGELSKEITVRIYNDSYVEGDETIELSYTINAQGGDAYAADYNQQHIITIIDDDLTPGTYTQTLYASNWNRGNDNWEIENGGNTLDTWGRVAYGNAALDPAGRPFFFINSGGTQNTTVLMDEKLVSPSINTVGKTNMVLSFAQDWYPTSGAGSIEKGTVEIWDGNTWQILLTQNQATGRRGNILNETPNVQNLPIHDSYANMNMKIRFRYQSGYHRWWAIDNVKITSSNTSSILTNTNINQGDNQYLGPNETAVFYDPATGKLMAKIKNMTSHDYGCTTVEIDRSGIDETNWFDSYSITNKTFKVTPTNNKADGEYEITLYYKSSELPNFNGSAITSMGKSAGSILTGNSANSSWAELQTEGAFDSDLAYTAVFDSGFSGFGLSTAPPVGPLPVTLVRFEGESSKEGNMLLWETAQEINHDHFIVERSTDARRFEAIGRINQYAPSDGLGRYQYLDRNPADGTNYYRLKQVDLDGSFAYSKMVVLHADALTTIAYPNPASSRMYIGVEGMNISGATIEIVNSAGQLVQNQTPKWTESGKIEVDVEQLVPGIYQLILKGGFGKYYYKIIKE
ncbi:M4 family metallopeptidase [Dyadobacter tibetensis]|uniref:M4 family metallopeptidase n=1 Tax=Dyadobacter tibetensis TaxID=1211851 RepID=UPI00046FA2B1|nr:M4 family metallopeptidase [Dyadobacter tibetensis]